MVEPSSKPVDKAIHMTTRVASFAACGSPAPSSFETRVLQRGIKSKYEYTNNIQEGRTYLGKYVSIHIYITSYLMAVQRPNGTMNSKAPVFRLQNS